MHSAPGTGLETGTGSGVHLEVFGGPQKNKKNVWLGKRREIAKVTFKKTIEGRYRDGVDGYAEVGALLIYWKGENKAFKEEIEELEDVLKSQYHFKTKVFGIPKEHSGTALVQQIAVWAHEFNGPDKLSIIYYGGHAHKDEAQLDNLRIIREIYDAEHDTSEYGPDPAASFDFEDLTHPLKIPDTDQLLIVDCCFAAKAFSTRELGKRKFELLSSAPPGKEALGPAYAGSFTKNLAFTLEKLLKDKKYGSKGFSTSTLYRELYFQQADSIKPFLFDQSPKNYGRIWIKPLPDQRPQTNGTKPNQFAVELRLQLSEMPDQHVMRELASNMQYLPYVRQMEFQHLHAPEQQLNEFMLTLQRIQALKPLVRRLRQQRERKRAREIEEQGVPASPIIRRASTLEINERTKEVYDWPGEIDPRSGTATPEPRTPRSESNVHVSDDTIEHRVPIHRVGKLFSYAYYFDSFEFEPTKMKQSRGGFIVHQIKILLSIWVRLAVVLLVIPLRIAELIHKYLE